MKVSNIHVINVTIKQKGRIIWEFISSWTVSESRAIKTLGNKSFIRLFDIFMCEVMWSISECDNPGNPVTLPYIHNTYTNCHLYNNTRKQELFSFYFKHLNNSIK